METIQIQSENEEKTLRRKKMAAERKSRNSGMFDEFIAPGLSTSPGLGPNPSSSPSCSHLSPNIDLATNSDKILS